jgi:hypothetical protein
MAVPYTFGNATTAIPLTNLDANFNTPATLGNAAVGLGNTTTSVGNLTLTNTTMTEIQETANVTATAANGTINLDVLSNVVMHLTSNAAANWTINFRGNSATTLNAVMANNASLSASVFANQGSTAYYNSNVTIDGSAANVKYQGGTAWTAGNANSVDCYSYVIIKTGTNTYNIFASQTQFN